MTDWLLWTLLASSIAALCALLAENRVSDPRDRQWLWRGVGLVALMPTFGVLLSWAGVRRPGGFDMPVGAVMTTSAEPVSNLAVAHGAAQASTNFAGMFSTVIIALVVLIWAWRVLVALAGARALQRTLRDGRPGCDDSLLQPLLREAAQRAGLERLPGLVRLENGRSAFATGWRRGCVVVPDAVSDLLSADEIEAVLIHECTHVRRGDLVWRRIERLVADILAFSPAAWLMRARLETVRELACDADAVGLARSAGTYGRALVKLVTPPHPPRASTAFRPKGKAMIQQRLEAILSPKRRRPAWLAAGLIGLVAFGPFAAAQMIPPGGGIEYTHPVLLKGRITSPWGMRTDPRTSRPNWHGGTDIAGELGQPVYAPASGTVGFAGYKAGYGLVIDLRIDDRTTLRFGHLKALDVAEGDKVAASEVLGRMGTLSDASKAHVHVEWLYYGKRYDPELVEGLVLVSP